MIAVRLFTFTHGSLDISLIGAIFLFLFACAWAASKS